MRLFLLRIYFYFFFFFQGTVSLECYKKQSQSYLKNKKIEIKFVLKILFYTVFISKLQKLQRFKSSRPDMFYKVFLKILQNSPKNTCAGVSFKKMLRAVASVSCQEYIKDKFLTHVPAFPSSNSCLFCFLSQCSDLPFEYFVLYLHCGLNIRSIFRTLLSI